MLNRTIPTSGEQLPVIGLGTWQVFDIDISSSLPCRHAVLSELKAEGGTVVDSSPMYGRAEEVVGELTGGSEDFFYATKVWTTGKMEGIQQMESSMQKMKRKTIDLMQIHNLVDWKTHLHTLRQWKQEGRVRYIGITHYTDSMHGELEKIISSKEIDFVQFNYSIINTHAEERLLPAAAEHGVATVINRPFAEDKLFQKLAGKQLPAWASDYGIYNWCQYILKYIISHPGVTCVIPATANPSHMKDNLMAAQGVLPDETARAKMKEWLIK